MVLPPPEGATPAMAQWFTLKAAQPDALLFFRMGDFYELFFADAQAASAALDIALTHRGTHAGAPIPMCGVPASSAESYLNRLIRRGFRVAVVEQAEAAAKPGKGAKAPIQRDLVRLVTPGTITEETLLEPGRANLLLALAEVPAILGAAWLDISSGLFETATLPPAELPALLARLDPAEIICAETIKLHDWQSRRGGAGSALAPTQAQAALHAVFGAATPALEDAAAIAAALALDYVRATQIGALPRLSAPAANAAQTLAMDAATRASLEIARARDGGTTHTLLASVQHTLTAAGARKLAGWLAAPLTEPAAIALRQSGWAFLVAHPIGLPALRQALRQAPDMARALGRLSLGRGGPRDLAALRDGLGAAGSLAGLLSAWPAGAASAQQAGLADDLPEGLRGLPAVLRAPPDLAALLGRALADPAPPRLDDGRAIAAGFDGELDAQTRLRDDSRGALAALGRDLAQESGVASLKIRHHAQLGYVIEAPAASVERLRTLPGFVLRQSMASGARFTHPSLSDLDRQIAEAAAAAAARQRLVFAHLVERALAVAEALAACADALALLDVLQSCARLAEGGSWCRAEITADTAFVVEAGRHPVVEAALVLGGAGRGAFIANGCDLSPDRQILLLTGPNMAGKSTYLRQNALLVVLAQAGLPVPAARLRLGVVDRLFSRVGATDDLARGRSTFMVEMAETAIILHQATPRSLVVVDEIGRGTATLDGLAIAWAVLEGLHSGIRCRCIFATHFHELASLAGALPRLAPHTMRVREWKGSVVFLHEVARGAASRSWGVHVAQLAGVPAPVVRRAAGLLAALERASTLTGPASLPLFAAADAGAEPGDLMPEMAPPAPEPPATPAAPARPAALAALASIDPDTLTPRDALDVLYRLKALLAVAEGDFAGDTAPGGAKLPEGADLPAC